MTKSTVARLLVLMAVLGIVLLTSVEPVASQSWYGNYNGQNNYLMNYNGNSWNYYMGYGGSLYGYYGSYLGYWYPQTFWY